MWHTGQDFNQVRQGVSLDLISKSLIKTSTALLVQGGNWYYNSSNPSKISIQYIIPPYLTYFWAVLAMFTPETLGLLAIHTLLRGTESISLRKEDVQRSMPQPPTFHVLSLCQLSAFSSIKHQDIQQHEYFNNYVFTLISS